MDMLSLSTGERILVLRHRRRMSKTELAERVGVSVSTITRYEDDAPNPNYDVLNRIAFVLNESAHFLRFGIEDPSKSIPLEPLIKTKEDNTKE